MLGKPTFTNKIVAKNLDVEEKKVASVMSFFYQELNQELRECNYPYIYVKGLGTFGLNLTPVEKKIKILLKHVKAHKKNELEGVGIRNKTKAIETLRENLFELFAIRRMIKQRRQENKKLKHERKNIDDLTGQLLPGNREEAGSLPQTDELL